MEKVIIGNAELYCADCMDVLPTLGKVDAVITDPPYGIGISRNPIRQKHEKKEWDDKPISNQHLDLIVKAANTQIIWGGNYFNLPPSQGFLVWDKCQPDGLTLAQVEMAWFSMQKPARLFVRRVIGYSKEHPTQKPIELMEWCIQQAGMPKTVLDPFMGSGTTGVACMNLDRKFIGIEINKDYFDIAVKRIADAQKQQKFTFSSDSLDRCGIQYSQQSLLLSGKNGKE